MAIRSSEPDFTILVGDEGLATLRLDRLYREWRSALVESQPPGAGFIDPGRHDYLAGMQLIFDVEREGDRLRFRYRHVGSHIISHIGVNPTGIYLDQHPDPAFAEIAGRACTLVVETRRPVHARARREIDGQHFVSEFLVLPVIGRKDQIDYLFVAQIFAPAEGDE